MLLLCYVNIDPKPTGTSSSTPHSFGRCKQAEHTYCEQCYFDAKECWSVMPVCCMSRKQVASANTHETAQMRNERYRQSGKHKKAKKPHMPRVLLTTGDKGADAGNGEKRDRNKRVRRNGNGQKRKKAIEGDAPVTDTRGTCSDGDRVAKSASANHGATSVPSVSATVGSHKYSRHLRHWEALHHSSSSGASSGAYVAHSGVPADDANGEDNVSCKSNVCPDSNDQSGSSSSNCTDDVI